MILTKQKNGFIDFLLLDEKGFPYVVLEAKSEDKDPLDGKEQARRYAQSQNVRFIVLSNSITLIIYPHPHPVGVGSTKRD